MEAKSVMTFNSDFIRNQTFLDSMYFHFPYTEDLCINFLILYKATNESPLSLKEVVLHSLTLELVKYSKFFAFYNEDKIWTSYLKMRLPQELKILQLFSNGTYTE